MHYIFCSGEIVLEKPVQVLFIIYRNALLQCLLVRRGEHFRTVGEYLQWFRIPAFPQGYFSIADPQQKAENQEC